MVQTTSKDVYRTSENTSGKAVVVGKPEACLVIAFLLILTFIAIIYFCRKKKSKNASMSEDVQVS